MLRPQLMPKNRVDIPVNVRIIIFAVYSYLLKIPVLDLEGFISRNLRRSDFNQLNVKDAFNKKPAATFKTLSSTSDRIMSILVENLCNRVTTWWGRLAFKSNFRFPSAKFCVWVVNIYFETWVFIPCSIQKLAPTRRSSYAADKGPFWGKPGPPKISLIKEDKVRGKGVRPSVERSSPRKVQVSYIADPFEHTPSPLLRRQSAKLWAVLATWDHRWASGRSSLAARSASRSAIVVVSDSFPEAIEPSSYVIHRYRPRRVCIRDEDSSHLGTRGADKSRFVPIINIYTYVTLIPVLYWFTVLILHKPRLAIWKKIVLRGLFFLSTSVQRNPISLTPVGWSIGFDF